MSSLAAQIARDAWKVADQFAVDATYRRGGAGNPVPVRCRVTPTAPRAQRPGAAAGLAAGNASALLVKHTFMVTLPAPLDGEVDQGNGVTASGGIVRLASPDTLEVPGHACNQPGEPTLMLRVGARPMGNGGLWTAEASIG